MQRDEAFRQAHSAAPENEEGGLFSALLSSAPSLLSRYHNQLLAMRDTFRLELVLNLKCGLLILCFSVVLGCVLLSTWIGLNALLYFGLAAIDAPQWTIALAIAALHIIALVGLFKSIKQIFSQMGFNQLLDILGASSAPEEVDAQ